MRRENLARAGGFQNSCCADETTPEMRAIKIRERIVGDGMAPLIDRDTPRAAIPQQHPDCRNVPKLRQQRAVLRRTAPPQNGDANDRLERGGVILDSEIPVEQTVFVGVDGLHRPFPWTNLFFKHAANVRNGMEVEMPADVFVAKPGTKEQPRCV